MVVMCTTLGPLSYSKYRLRFIAIKLSIVFVSFAKDQSLQKKKKVFVVFVLTRVFFHLLVIPPSDVIPKILGHTIEGMQLSRSHAPQSSVMMNNQILFL